MAKSQTESKVLLVIFGADWCPYCKNLGKLLSEAKISARISGQLNWIEIAADKNYKAGPSANQIFKDLNEKSVSDKFDKIPGFPFLAFYNPATQKVIWMDSEKFETDEATQKTGVLHDPELMIQSFAEAVQEVR